MSLHQDFLSFRWCDVSIKSINMNQETMLPAKLQFTNFETKVASCIVYRHHKRFKFMWEDLGLRMFRLLRCGQRRKYLTRAFAQYFRCRQWLRNMVFEWKQNWNGSNTHKTKMHSSRETNRVPCEPEYPSFRRGPRKPLKKLEPLILRCRVAGTAPRDSGRDPGYVLRPRVFVAVQLKCTYISQGIDSNKKLEGIAN